MPGKYIVKEYAPESYYHIYNRGWNKTEIFLDQEDYRYFEWLLDRYLSLKPKIDKKGREFTNLRNSLSLNAYCLMPNHFHLFIFQNDSSGIVKLMSGLCTAYTMYFNKKYKRRGTLFENRYRAVLITRDDQLQHITRYIHLNPKDYKQWKYSSYDDYLNEPREWIETSPILELFTNKKEYEKFVGDYEDMKTMLELIKQDLADNLYS